MRPCCRWRHACRERCVSRQSSSTASATPCWRMLLAPSWMRSGASPCRRWAAAATGGDACRTAYFRSNWQFTLSHISLLPFAAAQPGDHAARHPAAPTAHPSVSGALSLFQHPQALPALLQLAECAPCTRLPTVAVLPPHLCRDFEQRLMEPAFLAQVDKYPRYRWPVSLHGDSMRMQLLLRSGHWG